ncbi:MAG: (2Fe-2S) ferredoxin domain-containing protein [Thermoguttaceae bacterium]|nr:(2Fe-2S) ferredoxin domain-containing protein [Thermoguttaceae bacterium]
MAKLKPDDLDRIRETMARTMSLREGEARARVTVHLGTCGIAAGARKVMSALMDALAEREAKDVILTTSGCAGLCSSEPMMTVELRNRPPVKYVKLDEAKARKVFQDHVLDGNVVQEYALALGSEQLG